jgi:hypothetical protein
MLGELTEQIVTYLNGLGMAYWGYYRIPDFISVEACLDPEQLVSSKEPKIYVMPLVTSFSQEMTGRASRSSIGVDLQISIALLLPFSGFSRNDVTDWNEVKRVLELREKLDLNTLTGNWNPYLITNVEAQPPVEIELNQRNFLSVTDFTFNRQACTSQDYT